MIPGLGRSPGEGNGYPLQYSGLENPMDYSPWGRKESDTRLSDFHFSSRAASVSGLWGWDSVPQPHPKAVLEGVWGRQCPAPMVQTLLSSWRCSEPLPLSYQPLTAAHNCPLPYLRSNLPSPFPEQGVKPGGRAGIWARVCCGGWLRNLGK